MRSALFVSAALLVLGCGYRNRLDENTKTPATAAAQPAPADAPASSSPPPAAGLQTFQTQIFDKTVDVDAVATPQVKVVTEPTSNTTRNIVQFDIGAGSTVVCSLLPLRTDPGALLAKVASAATRPKAPSARVVLVTSGPMLVLESAPGDDHPFVAAITTREKGTALCAMDGSGSRPQFEKAATQVTRALPGEAIVAFREVLTLKDNGKVAGFMVRRVSDVPDGRANEEWITALLQKEGAPWLLLDAVRVAVVDKDAKMVRLVEIGSANGEVVSKTSVERKKPGGTEYAYEITGASTEPRKGTFKHAQLSTELAMASRVRTFAGGKAKELRFAEFDDKSAKPKAIVFKKKADKLTIQRGTKDVEDCALDPSGICADKDTERLKAEGAP